MALSPDLYYQSVPDIDLEELGRRGIRALLIDLDNTLVLRNSVDVSPAMRDWIASASARSFKLCIVSNNWHERVQLAADSLGMPIVGRASKPLPGAFRKALRLLGVESPETAVIGDQVFTDILGGHLIGATTILVVPLAGGSDLPHTALLRAIERRLLSGREPARAAFGQFTGTEEV